MPRWVHLVFIAGFIGTVSPVDSLAQLSAPAGVVGGAGSAQTSERYTREIQTANELFAQRRFFSSRQAFERANALRKNASAEAWFGMARASASLKLPTDAEKQFGEALKHVGADRPLEAAIRMERSQLFVSRAKGPDDDVLSQAIDDLGRVRALEPTRVAALYHRGVALLTAYRDTEGLADLQAFVAASADTPEATVARQLIATPRRARERFAAPAFEVQTVEGRTITSESLRGKVVLLDFWGSWCPPCVANTPGLVALHARLQGQPVVFIGIALSERTREVWQKYVDDHGMRWAHAMSTEWSGVPIADVFKINAVPDYIVIDAEGIVRARMDEVGFRDGQLVARAIERALVTRSTSTRYEEAGR